MDVPLIRANDLRLWSIDEIVSGDSQASSCCEAIFGTCDTCGCETTCEITYGCELSCESPGSTVGNLCVAVPPVSPYPLCSTASAIANRCFTRITIRQHTFVRTFRTAMRRQGFLPDLPPLCRQLRASHEVIRNPCTRGGCAPRG